MAKRKLVIEGPLTAGTNGFRDAVIVIAAELRLHDIDQETALAVCRSMPVADAGSSSRRDLHRQASNFTSWVFGLDPPLLTGCPSSPRHSGDATTSRLRDVFAPYCDSACRATCSMRTGSQLPEAVLATVPEFDALLTSTLWRALNQNTFAVWKRIAAISATTGHDLVYASQRYLVLALRGAMSRDMVRRATTKLHRHGVITLVNRQTGLRRVHRLTAEQVAELEASLGTADKSRWDRIVVLNEQLDYTIRFPDWRQDETLSP